MERNLDPAKLLATAETLARWVQSEFPAAHLGKVAGEVQVLTQEAVAKAAQIRQPIWYLRVGVGTLLALAVGAAVYQIAVHPFGDILAFLDHTKGAAVYMGGAVALLIGLEMRWKRRNALRAINELRAIAHVVDMHQLAKDQAIEQFREAGNTAKIIEYLHACIALLALLSKVGQLYVEHFPDTVATSSVNEFEMIATGLSNKIWMKILSMQKS